MINNKSFPNKSLKFIENISFSVLTTEITFVAKLILKFSQNFFCGIF